MRSLTPVALVAGAVLLAGTSAAPAQERLTARRTLSAGAMVESWSFGDGILQTTLRGDTVRLSRATRLSLPIAAELWFGERWQLGIAAAFVDGRARLEGADSVLGVQEYSLTGVTDVKLTLTAHIVPDHVLVTLGVNAPPGGTSLDPDELEAVRIFAAPALGFEVPSMGLGRAGTAGVVLARQVGRWAWALGASYELRRGSTPLVVSSGLPALDFNPSDAVHLTLGTEGLVGAHAMTVGLSADVFSNDEYSASDREITSARTKLGPILTAEWQLRLAMPRLRETVIYVTDRYRTRYSRAGTKVPESSANYLDAGVHAVAPLSPRAGIAVGAALRHQTGLKADSSVASAAAQLGVVTLGLRYEHGNYMVQPFVRGQLGRIDTRRATADPRGVVGGVTVSTRF